MKLSEAAGGIDKACRMLREQVLRGHGLTHFEAVATLALLDEVLEHWGKDAKRLDQMEVEKR